MTFFHAAQQSVRNRRSASQAFDSGSQRQIVSLNALSRDFAGQMLILRHLSGVTSQSSLVIMLILNGVSRASSALQVASVRGPKV